MAGLLLSPRNGGPFFLFRFPGPTAVIPQYYGVHWGVYPANIIQQQQGGQPRRPPSPSQNNDVTTQNSGNLAAAAAAAAAAGNLQGQLGQYQVSAASLYFCLTPPTLFPPDAEANKKEVLGAFTKLHLLS